MAQQSQTTDDAQIQTGAETQDGGRMDAAAWASDGEYTTEWDIRREDATTVRVFAYRCHGDAMVDVSSAGGVTLDVAADKSTEEWARECANADPQLAVELARDEFADD